MTQHNAMQRNAIDLTKDGLSFHTLSWKNEKRDRKNEMFTYHRVLVVDFGAVFEQLVDDIDVTLGRRPL